MSFESMGLDPRLLLALSELGYEQPTPIQEKSIPLMLEGKNIVAQAQTGTGKTAAFALPALMGVELEVKQAQVIVLAPTRELAIQVAEAFYQYAKHIEDFHVIPIYGGADFQPQLRALKRGVHVVIGTPGRVMDHMRRGTLKLDQIKTLVLDEADEMLKMGFIDDIKWILEQMTHEHQTVLFSATMPESIRKIAQQHIPDAENIKIAPTNENHAAITQCYVMVNREHKVEALTRILETEDFEAAILFVRTKMESSELAEKLLARGYIAAAINGDMNQKSREQVIKRIKNGSLDLVVATEVAARGLDVERIGLVINFDIPSDVESYVHRIGRTGRAGREGKAIVFVTPREKRMLKEIERLTKSEIVELKVPSRADVEAVKLDQLAQSLVARLGDDLDEQRILVDKLVEETGFSVGDVAAAVLSMLQQKNSTAVMEEINFNVDPEDRPRRRDRDRSDRPRRRGNDDREWSPRPPRRDFGGEGRDRSRREFGGEGRSFDRPRRDFGNDGRFERAKFGGGEGRGSDRPRRDFGGEGRSFDRPRREFGGEGRSFDRPRRDAGGEGRSFDRLRREFGGEGRSFDRPRREGGEGRSFDRPRREGGEGRSFDRPRREGGEGRSFDRPRRDAADRGENWARSTPSKKGGKRPVLSKAGKSGALVKRTKPKK